jgi:DNA-directed RNA polymerase II subunit RPB4
MATANGASAGPRPAYTKASSDAAAAIRKNMRDREETSIELTAESELNIGHFEEYPTLSVSEAKYLIETLFAARGRSMAQGNEVLGKMQNYMDTFYRFLDRPQFDELESLFKPWQHVEDKDGKPLMPFERAQLRMFGD